MNKWTKNMYQPKVLDESILAFYRLQGMNADTSEFNQFESHSTCEIFVLEEGDCKYFIQDQVYELQPGDILLLDGLTLHKSGPISPDTYIRSMVHFSPVWLKKMLLVLGMPSLLDPFQKLNNCILRTGFDASGHYVAEKIKWIAEQLEAIDQEFKSTGKINVLLETEVKIEFLQLLVKIYKMSECEQMRVEQKKTEKKQHAENIASWINQHYCEKVSLERLAKELNLNKYYLSHVFKEVTGYTVMQYVMECRLIQVKYLLEMKLDQSLEDIFLSTGFESAAHFSRFFKARIGMTPTSYRKMKGRKTASYYAQH
ncbi:AraC family transcriptional regulator [Pradoshia eiseniae]|uniref:AraC family transcriptional regulator n=1 Tax=Pradoshia eiseniae TaxID=2064768 RepID=A0A2S7MWG6_9BACI|nr:AraC family transcriptional regulator [Pradoshia eiseniae]PQD94095.1 AraC family transcriptional regulator [Pradoshia eiseniae]